MMRFFVVLSAVAAALAQTLTINTPQGVLACQNYQVSWIGGAGPYILQVQPGGDTSAAALETFTNIAASPYQWHVIEGANTQVFLRLHDNNGAIAESGTFTIQSAGSTACSPVTGGTTSAGSSSSGAAVPPPASPSSTPPVVGGTTSTTPAPAGSSGSSSSHASSSSTTSPNGASSAHVAGGLVGLVGAVAVALAA